MIPSEIFASHCTAHYPMPGACGALPMPLATADHEIPFIISITKLDEDEDNDGGSEISLEEGLAHKSTIGTETAPTMSNSYSQSFSAMTPSSQSWTYSAALAGMTRTCMPMETSDMASSTTDGSISWPSDEEEDHDSDEEDDIISNGLTDRENSQHQLITAVHDCDDGSSHYFKADIVCGGFKFWSSGDVHKNNLLKNQVGSKDDEISHSSADRDEEDCRDSGEKPREEVPGTAASV
jgi:hypothetical protein